MKKPFKSKTNEHMSPLDTILLPSGSSPSNSHDFRGLTKSQYDKSIMHGRGGSNTWWYAVGVKSGSGFGDDIPAHSGHRADQFGRIFIMRT